MFLVKGKYLKNGEWVFFKKSMDGKSKEHVLERMYSEMGGNHRVKRRNIRVEGVETVGKGD
jgi:ribosomal protein L20A (L18A)